MGVAAAQLLDEARAEADQGRIEHDQAEAHATTERDRLVSVGRNAGREAVAGDEQAATELSLATSRTQRHAYEGWLADAKSLGVDAFQDATAAVTATSSVSVMVLLAYLVLAVAVSVAVALWVVRTVLRPTYRLVRLLSDAGEGQTPA